MSPEERSPLESLNAVLRSEDVRKEIPPVVERVRAELVRKKRGANDLGTDSVSRFRSQVTGGDSVCLGFRPASGRGHRRRTASEQSSADDVVPREGRYANRRAGTVAIECVGQ